MSMGTDVIEADLVSKLRRPFLRLGSVLRQEVIRAVIENFMEWCARAFQIPRAEIAFRPCKWFRDQLRSIIPAHRSAFATCLKSVMDARDRQKHSEAKERYDATSHSLSPLPIGARLRIQDPTSKLGSHAGVVIAIGRYTV